MDANPREAGTKSHWEKAMTSYPGLAYTFLPGYNIKLSPEETDFLVSQVPLVFSSSTSEEKKRIEKQIRSKTKSFDYWEGNFEGSRRNLATDLTSKINKVIDQSKAAISSFEGGTIEISKLIEGVQERSMR